MRTRFGLLAAVFTSALASAVLAPGAGAYLDDAKGRPGAWTVYKAQGSHFNPCGTQRLVQPPPRGAPYWWPTAPGCWVPWIISPGPVVARSPASAGRQIVTAQYELSRFADGRWITFASRVHTISLDPGQRSAQLPRLDWLPRFARYLRVGIGVVWADSQDRTLGIRAAVFNSAGDYECRTRFRCVIGEGWVTVPSPGIFP